ncbi:YraN family protein [Nitratidesulfovibrio sp. D1]|uniref:YraN family protein n=1 Tax=Nitratidesulfovibrio sp. D1 TaxID=3440151 RepID=UPI003EB884C1
MSPRRATPPATPSATATIGARGEEAAARLLAKRGLRVLARNWRHGGLELDIVCDDRGTLVFVEVKTRAASGPARPDEALTPAKRGKLVRAARQYLAAHDAWDRPCRFDLVCVVHDGATLTLEHYPHAFDLTASLGGGDAAWQPW